MRSTKLVLSLHLILLLVSPVHETIGDDISLIMEYMHMDLDHCMKTYPDIPQPYKTSILRDVAYMVWPTRTVTF